jgi:hypothetical protein
MQILVEWRPTRGGLITSHQNAIKNEFLVLCYTFIGVCLYVCDEMQFIFLRWRFASKADYVKI